MCSGGEGSPHIVRDLTPARGRQTDRRRAGIQPSHVEKGKGVMSVIWEVWILMKDGAKILAEYLTLVWSVVFVRPGENIALACRPPERKGSDLGVPDSCLPRPARRPEQSYARRVLPDFPPFLLPSWRTAAAAYSTLLTLPPWSE